MKLETYRTALDQGSKELVEGIQVFHVIFGFIGGVCYSLVLELKEKKHDPFNYKLQYQQRRLKSMSHMSQPSVTNSFQCFKLLDLAARNTPTVALQ